MATNVDEKIDADVDTEGMGAAPPTDAQNESSDTGNGQSGIPCRTRLLTVGRLLHHLLCLGYSFYLIWLLACLKDNNNYWFLSFIPVFFNVLPLWTVGMAYCGDDDEIYSFRFYRPVSGVVFNLIVCFTGMLTRQAYYHRQPDEFIDQDSSSFRASKHYSDFTGLGPTVCHGKKTG